ncbi:tryptophan-rich sensory protein [Sphingomonas glaciei]|uniref:Tryptophan-rich sensory protein n=1 Tax=Sphingomonas glaciei TaxID=2938948 RepID=A0ABY5MZE0_9SPHN|nr:tryptophan-rich sensory protein [Sphingomonas glaciei]
MKLIAQATERKAWWKVALVTVPVIVVLGNLSGLLSNSGYSNPWFDAVRKPGFMPPGWVFGVAWTILYTLMGLSVAMVISAPNSAWRRRGLIFFTVQLVLNYLWSPVFFGAAAIDVGFLIIIAMAVALCLTISLFWRVEKVAALLLLPYLAWLCLATALNFEIGRLNPGADRAPLGITGG